MDVMPHKAGLVRRARVHTVDGPLFTRNIRELCLLEKRLDKCDPAVNRRSKLTRLPLRILTICQFPQCPCHNFVCALNV